MLAMPVSPIQKYLYSAPQLDKPLYLTSLDLGGILHHTLRQCREQVVHRHESSGESISKYSMVITEQMENKLLPCCP